MNPFCIYHLLLVLSITTVPFFSYTGFVMLSSQSSFVICMSVFDILQIPSECSQICSGCSPPTYTSLAMGLGPKQSTSNIKLHNTDILVNFNVVSPFTRAMGGGGHTVSQHDQFETTHIIRQIITPTYYMHDSMFYDRNDGTAGASRLSHKVIR
jgi:hypothetical protein